MDFQVLDAIGSGFISIADFNILLIMSAGVVGGIVIGTLPGLSSVMAITLMLPVAIGLGPVTGLALLGAIYCAALYGGANSAILLNTPGTPSSLPTAFDGFPLTRKGQADFALYLALFASVFGGLFGTLVLMVAFVPLARLSLLFGPSEFFWLAMIGLSAIAAVSPGRLVQGILSAAIGLFLTTVGQNINTGNLRFTFGIYELAAGIGVIPVLLGVFSISQAMLLYETEGSIVAEHRFDKSAAREAGRTLTRKTWLAIRTSAIGTYVGILPGAGGAIASILAYNHARKSDRDPERFGSGAAEGVLASEAANNAQVSSSLVPMMGLGIPGNVNAAVIMGALLSFGIQPGMNLVNTSGDIAFGFIASLIVANILMLFIGIIMIPLTAQVLRVPNRFLGPGIMVLCIVGAYAATFDLYGVWVAFAAGILGYLMIKFDLPIGPLALGVVLGPLAETGLAQSQQIGRGYGGVLPYMVSQPISLLLAGFLIFAGGLAAFRFFRGSKDAAVPAERSSASIAEICFFALILLGSAALLFSVRNLSSLERIFPTFVLSIILMTGLASLVTSLRRAWKAGRFASAGIGITPLAVSAATALYILCISVVGYFSTTFVFLWIGFMIGHQRHSRALRVGSIAISAAIATGLTAVIFALFAVGLNLNFPDGIIG